MAAHRYWRALGLEAYGAGDLELSAFWLLDPAGVQIDATAALSANTAPSTGALANLQDADLATAARWAALSVPTLALSWDFGVAVDVSDIRLAGDNFSRFALVATLQFSDDSLTWFTLRPFAGFVWPGVGAATASSDLSGRWSTVGLPFYASVSSDGSMATVSQSSTLLGIVGLSSGTRQFEAVIATLGAGVIVGVALPTVQRAQSFLGSSGGGYSYSSSDGKKWLGGAFSAYVLPPTEN